MESVEDKEALSFVVIRDAGINIKMAKIQVEKSKMTLGSVDGALRESTAFRRSALSSHFLTLNFIPLGTPFFLKVY